jgi:hypothetical protein
MFRPSIAATAEKAQFAAHFPYTRTALSTAVASQLTTSGGSGESAIPPLHSVVLPPINRVELPLSFPYECLNYN